MSTQVDDPVIQLWRRVRRPLAVFVFAGAVFNQFDRLTSPRPFLVTSGAVMVVFWGFVSLRLFRGTMFPDGSQTSVEYWRSRARSELRVWALWTSVAVAWLVWGEVQGELRPLAAIVLVFPGSMLVASLVAYRLADRTAEKAARLGAGPPQN